MSDLHPLHRPTWAEVDLAAIAHNVGHLKALASPARFCAVVKADGYGHGAVEVSRAALRGGADWLAVALVEEGIALREAGIDSRILLLSEPPPQAMEAVVEHRLTPTLYTRTGVEAAIKATKGNDDPLPVHVKIDTGMHRVGADPTGAKSVAAAVAADDTLRLEGVWTHFAVADEPDRDDFTATQLTVFEAARESLPPAEMYHAANSAGMLAHPKARLDLVRAGIAMYGCSPSPALDDRCGDLRPALSLKARVSLAKRVAAGESLSYGLLYTVKVDSLVATVPLGYADGVPRGLALAGGEVLIGGRRRPIAGTVTMDQLLVDCGPNEKVSVGDEVVLIGRQGNEQILADEWAERMGTINYEILCGIGPRVPRVYLEA
ncbi:MAG: alanine racemase [Acidimicrobiales bacterium]